MKGLTKRIGLYGGTFDPPHAGHVRAAEEFIRAMGLDTLYIMPANVPPHKKIEHDDDPRLRLEMCRIAFGGIDGVQVSDYEISKSDVSYTVDTLRYMESVHEGDEIFMLLGDDMLLSLDEWRNPEEIFRAAHIVCMRRYTDDNGVLSAKKRFFEEIFCARISIIDEVPMPASSTEIRERLMSGDDCGKLLPCKVAEYIKRHGMYGV